MRQNDWRTQELAERETRMMRRATLFGIATLMLIVVAACGEAEPPQRLYERGGIAMANDGTPNSNGSRLFFILGDLAGSAQAPHKYTVFGDLKPGHAPSVTTLDKIESAQEEVVIRSLQATEGCLPIWGGYGPC